MLLFNDGATTSDAHSTPFTFSLWVRYVLCVPYITTAQTACIAACLRVSLYSRVPRTALGIKLGGSSYRPHHLGCPLDFS